MIPGHDRDWFPPAVGRFVGCVESGTVLKATEFAGAVTVRDSSLLRDAGSCRYDSGAIADDGRRVILLFHCRNDFMEQGIGAFLEWDGEAITRLNLVPAEIQPGRPN